MAHLTLIRGATIFAPQPLGTSDLLIAGNRVAAIGPKLDAPPESWNCDIIDATGLILIPGLIDTHTHMTGGGGEAGASTKVPPPHFSSFTTAGVTTAIGLLGTDGTTRSVGELLAAARGLSELGLNAFCYTGSYDVPPPTITGNVRSDIVHIDRIVAVGELAISDHRSSQPTIDEVLRIASQAHTAGMMTGKAGLVHFHLGDGERKLELIQKALATSELPKRTFHPTHVNRNPDLWTQAKLMAGEGLTIDITAFPDAPGEPSTESFLKEYVDEGLPLSHLTMSSDGGGCLPNFNCDGELLHMDVGRSDTLLIALRAATDAGVPLEAVLPTVTANPARLFRFHGRGQLTVGSFADIVLLNSDYDVVSTIANGIPLVSEGAPVVRGPFEERSD